MKSLSKSIAVLGLALMLSGTVFSCKSKEGTESATTSDTATVDTTTMAPEQTPPPTPTMDTVSKDTIAMPAK